MGVGGGASDKDKENQKGSRGGKKLLTVALSTSNSIEPIPSNLWRSNQPFHITQTPFNINWDFKCT